MKVLAIIPARYASTRFPGKPLAMLGDTSMIMRVYNQVKKVKQLHEIIVATDDKRIYDHVKTHKGNVIMTSAKHKSGTERCGEVMRKLKKKFDVVINIQGDEPFINPQQIRTLIKVFSDNAIDIATLSFRITNAEEIFNPNVVKVVCNKQKDAMYFSRNPIPYFRSEKGIAEPMKWLETFPYQKHIGIYGYKSKTLKKIIQLSPVNIEKTESLEQLRWLHYGYKVRVINTAFESVGIDTPEDFENALRKLQ